MGIERLTMEVRGMTCGHCVAAVKKALERIPGVGEVEVTLDPPRAKVAYDPAKTTPEALAAAAGEEGYPSSPTAAG